jgi:DNA-binding MurR/RpiR family transcriptional regulator
MENSVSSRDSSIEGRIHQHYDNLPKAERKLADLLLDFPGEVAAYSATELADLANVSKAAATRLFQRLGFKNFEEARRLARDTQTWGSPLYMQRATKQTVGFDGDLTAYFEDESAMLKQTLDDLKETDVSEIVSALKSSKRLWLIGFRYNHFIAAYGHWQFTQFRPDVHLLPVSGQTIGEHTSHIGKDDMVIIAGIRRRTTALQRMMELISGSNAKILYLTDQTARNTLKFATWTIRCSGSGKYMFDSYSAPISVLRYLSLKTFTAMGKTARTHLEKIERHHELLSELA